MTNETREYRSNLFSMLMEVPEYALQVFNALSGKNITDPQEVELFRIDSGVALSIRNDASFIVRAELNVYEHQSTNNPNMALRELIYVADLYRQFVKKRKYDLFGNRKILLPVPHFAVFYNGVEELPPKKVYRLSDSYEPIDAEQGKQTKSNNYDLELVCVVYNINKGHGANEIEGCKVLQEYTYFVDQVKQEVYAGENVRDALQHTIDKCIHEHVLEDFLRRKGQEVLDMTVLDMTFEARVPLIRRDAKLEGIEEGIQKGREEGIQECQSNIIRNMKKNGLSDEEIAKLTGCAIAYVQQAN